MCPGNDNDYRSRMGLLGRHANARLHRRLVACSYCLRECEYGVLYTLVYCSHILRQGRLWVTKTFIRLSLEELMTELQKDHRGASTFHRKRAEPRRYGQGGGTN